MSDIDKRKNGRSSAVHDDQAKRQEVLSIAITAGISGPYNRDTSYSNHNKKEHE